MTDFPRTLTPVEGPYRAAKIEGAALGMGDFGPATRALSARGLLTPDLITSMTLGLLANQPRKPRPDGSPKPSGVSGRVWVREQFTIHRPIRHDDPWRVEGEATGTYTKKGRAYSTTASRSFTSTGERFSTNLTTGLFSYTPDPDLADSVQGLPLEDTPSPEPDHAAAPNNPHLDALAQVQAGDTYGGSPVLVSLAMMAARDTDNPDNPIHSDPEQAKKAGLARPIAGGNHVLSFGLEPIMAALGDEVLLHGASFDVRWKAPTECDVTIVPTATVRSVAEDQVVVDIDVSLESGATAMVATVVIPKA